jgi:hypothetical protein
MSQATMKLDGLDQLRTLIGDFGDVCTDRGQALAEKAAQQAAEEIRAAYPEGPTGNLRKGVRQVRGGAQGHRVLSLVKSMAPHAHLYEYGTRRQPARPVVGEVAARVRRDFYGDLVQMVGEVTGADVRGGLIGE